jgi:hypothetical protein
LKKEAVHQFVEQLRGRLAEFAISLHQNGTEFIEFG